ncbi:hypothetical protein V8E55_004118 [Tylopilus felleus]
MENTLQCLCGKVFTVVKSPIAHESQCKVYRDEIDDLYSRHHRLTKNHHGDHRHKKKWKHGHRDSPPSNPLCYGPRRSFSPHRRAPTPELQVAPMVDLDDPPPSFLPGQELAHDNGNQVPLEVDNEPQVTSAAGPSNICAVVNPSQPKVATRSGQSIRLPACFKDLLPGDVVDLAQPPTDLASTMPSTARSAPSPALWPAMITRYQTKPDGFGLYHIYPTQPMLNPDQNNSIASHVDAPTLEQSLRTMPDSGSIFASKSRPFDKSCARRVEVYSDSILSGPGSNEMDSAISDREDRNRASLDSRQVTIFGSTSALPTMNGTSYDETVWWLQSLVDPLGKLIKINSHPGIGRVPFVHKPTRIVICVKWPLGTRAHPAIAYVGQYDHLIESSSEHSELHEMHLGLGFLFADLGREEEATCAMAVCGIKRRRVHDFILVGLGLYGITGI